jgi:hypothetical protein
MILKYLKKFGHHWKNERNTATSSLKVEKVTFIGAGRKLFFSVIFFFFVIDLEVGRHTYHSSENDLKSVV